MASASCALDTLVLHSKQEGDPRQGGQMQATAEQAAARQQPCTPIPPTPRTHADSISMLPARKNQKGKQTVGLEQGFEHGNAHRQREGSSGGPTQTGTGRH